MADTQNRTLPASARKIQKARAEGQVARSRDMAHFAALGVAVGLLATAAPALTRELQGMLGQALRFDVRSVHEPQAMLQHLGQLALPAMWMVLLCGGAAMLAASAAALASGGWNFTFGALSFRLDKFNPITGLGRMLSWHQLGDTLKSCVLALALATLGALYLQREIPGFIALLGLPLPAAMAQAVATLQHGLVWLLLLLAGFALIDVPLQRMRLMNQLKMSVVEAKQEAKEAEGSNEIKGRQRARMRELSNQRMLAAVPLADLVVMNPSHFAVALKYDDATMAAPRVLAKGADLMALRIRDAATGAKVPVLRAPPLARALYAHAELDREIPTALFAAVAQVLAYVYQLREAMAGRTAMPGDLPDLPVPAELDPQHGQPEAAV